MAQLLGSLLASLLCLSCPHSLELLLSHPPPHVDMHIPTHASVHLESYAISPYANASRSCMATRCLFSAQNVCWPAVCCASSVCAARDGRSARVSLCKLSTVSRLLCLPHALFLPGGLWRLTGLLQANTNTASLLQANTHTAVRRPPAGLFDPVPRGPITRRHDGAQDHLYRPFPLWL